tara:strand:+ start:34658 stop:35578 length:921 start_codon:yes stop_codon:yes gene_type:complete
MRSMGVIVRTFETLRRPDVACFQNRWEYADMRGAGALPTPFGRDHMADMKHVVFILALASLPAAGLAELPQLAFPAEEQIEVTQPRVGSAVPMPVAAPLALPDGETVAIDISPRVPAFVTTVRPPARSGSVPRTRWQHMQGHTLWTRAALSALKSHGKGLVDLVPGDIDTWCPAYRNAPEDQRREFWVGFLSALAKHESTYKPWAVGGGGRWYGLLQILPGTARGYKCHAGTGEALKSGAANLSCAVRIMAVTVPRDGVIYGPGGRGVAADWGPMRSASKRRDMSGWLRRQNYCKPLDDTRPRARP